MSDEAEPTWRLDLSPCGDSGCILRSERDAPRQHTNGGCQHLKERGPALTKLLMRLGAEVVRLREGDASERTAVVAHLAAEARACEEQAHGSPLHVATMKSCAYVVQGLADAIERGEHRGGGR